MVSKSEISRLITPEARESKLPKYARDTLGALRNALREAERRAEDARLATDPHGTDTFVHAHREKGPIGLPKGERVRFQVGPDLGEYVDVRVDRGGVQVQGGRPFAIYPHSSNLARLEVVE